MGEVQAKQTTELSNDINVITAEINAYKQVAGEAIFEIGRRLKHVKENDLAHGEFGKWLESVEIDRTLATRLMKIVNELGESNYATSHKLGVETLYLIATLPPDQREKQHTIPSTGETKTVDEMTVRELREVKRALKEAEKRAEQAERYAEEKENEVERLKEERKQQEKLQEDPSVTEALEYQSYGVKLAKEMYAAFDELSEWQKKYAWIITEKNEFKTLAESDPDFSRQFERLDEFWRQLSYAFGGERVRDTRNVVNVDFIEI